MQDSLYDEIYYERGIEAGVGLYTDYRWIPEHTIPLCAVLIEKLGIKEGDNILDFGCAKGFYVKAFRLLHRDAYGVDISRYAIDNAPSDVQPFVKCINGPEEIKGFYDWIIALDVLEHVPYENIEGTVVMLRSICSRMFCTIPLGDGDRFVIPISEYDTSHIIREDADWWSDVFMSCGFSSVRYTYHMDHVRERYRKWDKGIGFFLLEV